MAATFCTLRIPQGGLWQVTFLATLANVPVDITGWTAHMQIRRVKTSQSILAEYTTSIGGFITLDGPSGSVFLDVPGSITSGYAFGSGVFDIYAIDGASQPHRLAEGNVIVDETVTR